MSGEDQLISQVANRAVGTVTDSMGFQISKVVDIGVNGLLDILLGESKDGRRKEMNEHHDKLLEIVNHSNIPHLQDISSVRLTPMNASQSLKNEIETANSHIRSAITELMEARNHTRCRVCRGKLEEAIGLVGDKTGEILETSERVLAMQRLRDSGDIPPGLTYDDLNRKQKQLVEEIVEKFHPAQELAEKGIPEGAMQYVGKYQQPKQSRSRKEPQRRGKKPSARRH